MYSKYVKKRAPMSAWILDTAPPYVDYTGFGVSADKRSTSATPTKSVPLVSGAAYSNVFKAGSEGKFAQNLFKTGLERRPFALEAWVFPIKKTTTGPQQILSNDGLFDGLSIEGTVIKFMTSYSTSGNAMCYYDLLQYQLAHVVGLHTAEENQLWVNGELVASVDITDAQKADTYSYTDGYLYSGYTASTQELAMNGVAIYPSLSGDQISQNYAAGTDVLGQDRVVPQYGGLTIDLDQSNTSGFLDQTWDEFDDFSTGFKNMVEFGTDTITPSYVGGISQAGTWTTGAPLDSEGDTSVYGVMVEWVGTGITVDVTVDDTTWVSASNGQLISVVPSGFNPTGKDLQIRVNFAGGSTSDTAYLDSLHVVGFRDSNIISPSARAVTVTYPAVVRDDYEPTLYRDDNGVNLHTGTLTIGTDSTSDSEVVRTLELWIKPLSGTPTISVSGTQYRNGAASSSMPVGEWSLVHIVAAADVTTSITITGDAIIGQVSTYPTALSSTDVLNVFNSYINRAVTRFVDTQNTLGISEPATPANIYTHDWAIDGAG